uniref:Large tegument protein n=1 Tax=Mastomys natalensis cytomegalovirus 2 TaxID=2973540 RepID=A0A9Y1IMI4_9BETA|nr:large tegument protein [Mastomys natalensis cytomegalovirus 2]WEG69192.1 large tegument protein [Mastomys natalensis cytomegalovirus 2]WEG69331.1 large tegument protein [Mastomys natalensis cytomegalovirus 2]WEG69469.1 large tegument protein [Mastomys natalensis cytomegalovirus 2]WEG69607.1 large tegument protein [Mastomys natalensis cytomegalovirus 2]
MKIIKASRDQSDPVYGPRAGNQCMSNCFIFLHTIFLNDVQTVLDKDYLDIVLDNGAKLDAATELRLQKQSGTHHIHRLESEISNIIDSSVGITGHALSRPFNGTAETQDLGGYKCLGILDFLTYAKTKPLPTYIIITVGAHTRGIILTQENTLVFDPHTTDMSKEAAVYVCDDFNEVISVLAFFGTLIGDFYYDATIIYFIACETTSISPSDLLVKIMDKYKDPDIDVRDTALPVQGTQDETEQRLSKKRRASDAISKESIKTSRRTRRMLKVPSTILDVISDNLQTIESFNSSTKTFSDTVGGEWTIYHENDSFHTEYFTNVARQLLANNIDKYISLNKVTDRGIIQEFEDLMGLSEEMDNTITIIRNNDLLAPLLYKHHISQKLSHLSQTDALLATKILSLFTSAANNDFNAVSSWLEQLLENIPIENSSITEKELTKFIENNPIPSANEYVCLTQTHVKTLSGTLSAKRAALKERYEENDSTYRKTLDAISKLGLASNAAEAIRASIIDHLDDEQTLSLQKAAEAYFHTAYESSSAKMNDLLNNNHNRIITGFLPDSEIAEFLKYMTSVLENVHSLRLVNLLKKDMVKKLDQINEDILYLRDAKIKLNVTPSDPITKLRSEYEAARKEISDEETRIKEIIENMEDMITDVGDSSSETLNMLQAQIQEVENMAVDESDAERTDRLMHALTSLNEDGKKSVDFIQNLSASTIPSQSEIKSFKTLRRVLEVNTDLRNHYIETITKMIGNVLTQISDGNPPADDILLKITTMIEQLPYGNLRDELSTSTDIISQMSRRIRYSIHQKHSPQSLEDIIDFFSEHSTAIKNVAKTSWGKNMVPIYQKINKEYAKKIEEYHESEWLKRVKSTEIDSPETAQKLIESAPNKTILEKVESDIHSRLKKRMEAEADKRSADLKRLYEDMRKKLQSDLKVISDSFASNTPSIFSSIDLKGSQISLNKLTKDDQSVQIKTFNENLIKSLTATTSELTTVEKTMVLTILKKIDPHTAMQTGHGSQKHTETLLRNTDSLLMHTDLLFSETDRVLKTIARRLMNINHMRLNWRDPMLAFTPTSYLTSYKTYLELVDEVKRVVDRTKKNLDTTYNNVSNNIHDNTTQSDVTIKEHDPFSAMFKDNVKTQSDPFNTELEKMIKSHESEIKDIIADLNLKLKTKLERHIAKRNSQEMRWRDLVTQHRIRVPEGLEIDTPKLISDTVLSINKVLLMSENTLPYITAKRALEWTSSFILDAINEKKNTESTTLVPQLATLFDRCNDIIKKIDEKVSYNTRLETETLSTSESTKDSLHELQMIMGQLDPKRIVGGEKRYKTLHETLLAKQNRLSYVEEIEKLSAKYFELSRDIRGVKYGLDFNAQIQKIHNIRYELTPFKKDHPVKDASFPDETSPDDISIASISVGLSALERYVSAQRSLLENLISSQPLVSLVEDIPTFVQQTEVQDKEGRNRTDIAKISTCDVNTPLYRCTDVFGERRIMTSKGIQLYLYATHGNFLFESFSHIRHKSVGHAKDQSSEVVTRRYKSVTVIASIAATLQTFWNEIARYDIRDLLDGMYVTDDKRINTVINLKLFVYVLTVAWSESVLPPEPGQPEFAHTKEMNLLDFTTLMTALYPEYVYGVTTSSINNTLSALTSRIDRKTADIAMNTYENPPPYDMCDLKAFCINTKLWKQENIKSIMWTTDLVKQICTSYPKNKNPLQSTKLFQYMLAIRILPRDILKCIWTQFRPKYAYGISSLEDFVYILSDLFFRPYSTGTETMSGHLQTGEKIERQIVLKHKLSFALLDDFTNNDTLIDYLLGSFVFNIPITCGIYVANLLNGHYQLIVRHLENVPHDPDFTKVVRSRDLTFSQIPWMRTVQNAVERSWFSIQEERLRDLLQNPSLPDRLPLIIYDSSTNYVVSTVMPPHKNTPHEPIYITVKNPFSSIRIPTTHVNDDQTTLSAVPIDIDFIRRDPPRLNGTSETISDTQHGDSVPDKTLNEPLFSQTEVSTIVPKDTITTISDESVSYSFKVHPFRALSTAIRAAITILRETKIQLETFETDVCETIRRMKILYLH